MFLERTNSKARPISEVYGEFNAGDSQIAGVVEIIRQINDKAS